MAEDSRSGDVVGRVDRVCQANGVSDVRTADSKYFRIIEIVCERRVYLDVRA